MNIDNWYYQKLEQSYHDFAAANVTAITVIRPRPPLIIAAIIWLRNQL